MNDLVSWEDVLNEKSAIKSIHPKPARRKSSTFSNPNSGSSHSNPNSNPNSSSNLKVIVPQNKHKRASTLKHPTPSLDDLSIITNTPKNLRHLQRFDSENLSLSQALHEIQPTQQKTKAKKTLKRTSPLKVRETKNITPTRTTVSEPRSTVTKLEPPKPNPNLQLSRQRSKSYDTFFPYVENKDGDGDGDGEAGSGMGFWDFLRDVEPSKQNLHNMEKEKKRVAVLGLKSPSLFDSQNSNQLTWFEALTEDLPPEDPVESPESAQKKKEKQFASLLKDTDKREQLVTQLKSQISSSPPEMKPITTSRTQPNSPTMTPLSASVSADKCEESKKHWFISPRNRRLSANFPKDVTDKFRHHSRGNSIQLPSSNKLKSSSSGEMKKISKQT